MTTSLALNLCACSGDGGRDGDGDDGQDAGAQPMCDDYPAADNNFEVGSVVRNYLYRDLDDNPVHLCDYADSGYRLAMISISATDCTVCAAEIQTMTEVAQDHLGAVKVAEVFEDVTDSADLGQGAWLGVEAFDLLRCLPRNQMSEDFITAAAFAGYPTIPLIDLETMEVLVTDCWDYPSAGAADLEACAADHLTE